MHTVLHVHTLYLVRIPLLLYIQYNVGTLVYTSNEPHKAEVQSGETIKIISVYDQYQKSTIDRHDCSKFKELSMTRHTTLSRCVSASSNRRARNLTVTLLSSNVADVATPPLALI